MFSSLPSLSGSQLKVLDVLLGEPSGLPFFLVAGGPLLWK